jgi:hypothetical protein
MIPASIGGIFFNMSIVRICNLCLEYNVAESHGLQIRDIGHWNFFLFLNYQKTFYLAFLWIKFST